MSYLHTHTRTHTSVVVYPISACRSGVCNQRCGWRQWTVKQSCHFACLSVFTEPSVCWGGGGAFLLINRSLKACRLPQLSAAPITVSGSPGPKSLLSKRVDSRAGWHSQSRTGSAHVKWPRSPWKCYSFWFFVNWKPIFICICFIHKNNIEFYLTVLFLHDYFSKNIRPNGGRTSDQMADLQNASCWSVLAKICNFLDFFFFTHRTISLRGVTLLCDNGSLFKKQIGKENC